MFTFTKESRLAISRMVVYNNLINEIWAWLDEDGYAEEISDAMYDSKPTGAEAETIDRSLS